MHCVIDLDQCWRNSTLSDPGGRVLFYFIFIYLRDWVKKKLFGIFYVPTAWNIADIMTKALGRDAFERHMTGCGIEARASTTVGG